MVRRKETVNRVLVRKLGARRALMVEVFVMLWAMFAVAEERDPKNIEELAEAIGKSVAQVYRWQSDFRAAFPQWDSPRDLLDAYGIAGTVTVPRIANLAMGRAS